MDQNQESTNKGINPNSYNNEIKNEYN